ncbi:K02A2.6-like [Cordylochernes scorpioides]|uniref:K02A2.6-like n=1 Tax=Cordylochernes scorpioides TaxID=51811 RepID=A0ABY6KZB1_9ARAC|nr:K02A2.6-like [Cordylochernes scorpioides]
MNNLLSMRPLKMSSDVRTFRELFDNLSVQIRSLESLNVSIDVYGQLLCPIIIKLLPADLNLELNKELPTGYKRNRYVSEEMKYFFKSNGVYHLRSAPYFPATNGLAERFVQTLKRSLKNMRNEELNKSLANFLFTYRTVPHSSTREAPAVLFLKRMLKTKLEVKPGFKKGYSPDFEEDENILVRDFLGPNKWKEGKIVSRLGKCFYTVELNDGRLWRRHVCQLRKSYIAPSPASEIFPAGATVRLSQDDTAM